MEKDKESKGFISTFGRLTNRNRSTLMCALLAAYGIRTIAKENGFLA